jgi:hypothetical protein
VRLTSAGQRERRGFIAVWGFIGVVLPAIGLALGVGDPTRGFVLGQFLVIPIILWELFFATWLIVSGFNPSVVAAERSLAYEPITPPIRYWRDTWRDT